MKAVSALATGLRQAASAAGAARSLASAAARPAAAATAAAAAVPPPSAAGAAAAQPSSSMPSLSELLPPRPRKVVRRGGRKLPTIARPEDVSVPVFASPRRFAVGTPRALRTPVA